MATQEVVRDLPPRPIAPVDESVVVPESVKRAAAAADAIHAQMYQDPPEPQPEPPAAAAPEPEPQPEPPAAAAPEPEPQPEPGDPVPNGDEIRGDPWAGRYNAMKGRHDKAQNTIGQLQNQITELGDELMRTQQLLQQRAQPPQPEPEPSQRRLITSEDVEKFGEDFIDLARRAGEEAVQPQLAELRQQSVDLQRRLRSATRLTVGQLLDAQVPGWKQLMASPRFKRWLSLPDVYSGRVRKGLLDAAYQAADAPRVVAFFNGFLAEERATGQIADPAPQIEPPAAAPQPREPAVPLATLAAPGRATRPASGSQPETPADKPVFTRKQIADFYSAVRQGRYAGRETEKTQFEKQIFDAQREGRVR